MTVKRITTHRAAPATTTDADPQSIAQAAGKWSSHQAEVAHLPWSACPDAMVEDFVRASASDLKAMYGTSAGSKAIEVVGILLAPSAAATPNRVSVAWSASAARLELSVSTQPPAPFQARGLDLELEVPADAGEQDVRDALGRWAAAPSQRLILDPIQRVPAADLKPLLAQVEAMMGTPACPADTNEVMMVASAVMVLWDYLESRNAATLESRLEGMSDGQEEVAPGQQVLVQATRVGLDVPADPAPPAAPTKTASIKWRPS